MDRSPRRPGEGEHGGPANGQQAIDAIRAKPGYCDVPMAVHVMPVVDGVALVKVDTSSTSR